MLQSICVSCAKVFQARLGQPLPAQCWDCVNRGFGDSTLVRGSATEASEEQLEAAAVLAMARMDIESTRAQLAAANEAKEKAEQKAATAIQDFIHGRDKLCLVCGAKEPCHLKDTSTPPCTFEPSPIELLQIHRDLRAKVEKAERERDEANKDYEELLAQTERLEKWLQAVKHFCGCQYDNASDCCMLHYPHKKEIESANARLREALRIVERYIDDELPGWEDDPVNADKALNAIRAALTPEKSP